MVDSVTTIDCMRRNATKNPLNAPTATPMRNAGGHHEQRRQRRVLQLATPA